MTPGGSISPDLISKLLEYPRFRRMKIGREDLESLTQANGPVSYSKFVTDIFDLYGKAQRKRLVGDKTPGYACRMRTLNTLFPMARFVHLIRDGRDACLSAINWKEKAESLTKRFPTWSEDPVSTAALWWKYHVRMAREAGSELGSDRYYEIRYESLLADPADECKKLCTFLGLPYDATMLRFHEGRTRIRPGLSAKRAWLPITSGLRDWRTQMPVEDVERFEAVVGDILDELSYPRAVPRPQPGAQSSASVIHELFTRNVCSRGQALPRGW
jgi:sulfotransferase family protein